MDRNLKYPPIILIVLIFSLSLQPCFGLTHEEIQSSQAFLRGKPIGEKIAYWADRFVGIPYDSDPLGEYVSKATVVSEERVDCMYLTFRVVELALGHTPEEAIQIALEKRFRSKGILKDGKVINYDDRFEYGEDMVESGKWGKEISSEIGRLTKIKGSRGKDSIEMLPLPELLRGINRLKSGDILFFVKKPEKRKSGEIIGHIGITKLEEKPNDSETKLIYLIHASGVKGKGGEVKKVLLEDYLSKTDFIGVKITRFE